MSDAQHQHSTQALPSSLEMASGIKSSVIQAAGYDRQQSRLYLRFKSGSYRYENVPAEEWASFLAAPSKGAHFSHRIGHRYFSRRLSKAEASQLWGSRQEGRPHWLEVVLQPPSAEQTVVL